MRHLGIAEIAKLANVTIGTVDRALHGRKGIRESTRRKILEIARSVGYRPNLAARALSVRREPIRIGICIPREIHNYFDQLYQGINAEAQRAELLGIEAIWRRTERFGKVESEKVSELIDMEPSALILALGSSQGLTQVIDEAESRGIRVICVDTDLPASKRSTAVCVDAEASGHVAAELLGNMVLPGGRVAVITGMMHIEDHRRKTESFCDAYPKFCQGGVVVEVIEAHEDDDEGFQKSFTAFEQHKSIAGVYINTANCLPVCRAIWAKGMAGRVRLITTDLFAEMRPYFEKGTISASISSRPYLQGERAMRVAVDYVLNGTPLPKFHFIAPQLAMRSTFHLFPEMRVAQDRKSATQSPELDAARILP